MRRMTGGYINDIATAFDTDFAVDGPSLDEREIDEQVVDHLNGGFAFLDGRSI